MSPPPSNVSSDVDDEQESYERPRPTLVSLHFIGTALRRHLLLCMLAPVLGLLAAGMFMLAFPPPHAATASLVLTYDPLVEPTRAMATNISLLETQTLATRTITRLGLTTPPDDFLKSFTIEPTGSELLILTLAAPDDAEAVRRLEALTSVYLEFRSEQLSLQSNVLVDGLRERIEKLQGDVARMSKQIELLSAAVSPSASKLGDAIAQRASIQGRIETLQQSMEDATLRNSAVVESSRVLDPPTAEPGRAKRTTVLGLASGFVGGAAIVWGTVLFLAITSDRLRRRADVASALGVAVPVSVGRIAPLRKGWLWFPPLHAIDRRRADDRQRLAHAIEAELLLPQRRNRLAVAGVNNADEVSHAVVEAARSLAARGISVTIIDVTERGSRDLQVARSVSASPATPTVLRPRGLPALARGTADLLTVGHWDEGEESPSPELTGIALILADLDPAVGADHLTAWTDRVMVVVTAGRSSVEKARTISDQVRASGLEWRLAALLRTERTDDSSGTANFGRPAPISLLTEHERAEPTGRFEAR